MRVRTALLLLAFMLIGSIPACDCNSGYITSSDGDATSTETQPPQTTE
ncbi:MAG: hypothetical protein R3284_01090 [Rubricoccaceae bacterium]|nr:hypothetical protein [Rubricoccaceae bacterium]